MFAFARTTFRPIGDFFC